jgi:nicotinamide riboside kinase
MFGPESTGKTTLAIQLADHYKTAWFLNLQGLFARKWDEKQQICDIDDMLPIATVKLNLKITASQLLISICLRYKFNSN